MPEGVLMNRIMSHKVVCFVSVCVCVCTKKAKAKVCSEDIVVPSA